MTPEPELKITHTSGYSIIDANNIYRVECVIRNLHKYEDIRDDRDDLMLNENFLETMNQVLARSF